ncbi:MAG: hypothetical protein QNJ32_04645 [Xenococcaceae cyanobacterium MO_167.B27]|nr:hypothetical protein [Xenococcaceae cyanobacterium MO_167.B27]
MSRGSFEAGLEALGAFESGKPSGDPEQYRVQNTLGFTGKYQFGEALLIDLGYYQADTFYGNGAATNLWQGTWTAKAQAFGVNSIEDFRNSPEIQEAAIRDAFEFNWNIIETTLGNAGKTVDDFIGNTITFNDGGTEKSVTITPFGILAGAHLRGPYGLANLLLNGSVSYDEYGTSILRYVDEYAGYDVPVEITGGAVVNPPIEPPVNPTEPVDPVAPDPVIPNSGESLVGTDGVQDVFGFTWNWGENSVIKNFNSTEDTIDLKKFWLPDSQQVTIYDDSQGNAVIDLREVNNQTITLEGVSKSELRASNFQGLPDANTVLNIDQPSTGEPTPSTNPPTSPVPPTTPAGNTLEANNERQDIFSFTWNWGKTTVINNFDPTQDIVDLRPFNFPADNYFSIGTDDSGNAVVSIPDNQQSIILSGVSPDQLQAEENVLSKIDPTNPNGGGGTVPVKPNNLIIDGIDNQGEALQITLDQGQTQFTLNNLASDNSNFIADTNNPDLIDARFDGDRLIINTTDAGRGSIRLEDTTTGDIRYLGVRVKTADGQLPENPDYVSIGSVSEDTPADLGFWRDFGDGLSNKRIDSRYIYLNNGPLNNPINPDGASWRKEDARLQNFLTNSLKFGMTPTLVWYNIPDAGESYVGDLEHIQNQEYMQAYFEDLQYALDETLRIAGDETVKMILEPDFLGYMAQNSGLGPDQIFAQTDAVYNAGILKRGEDPDFGNNLQGLVQAINYTISKHEANVEFGWQFNLWASPAGGFTGVGIPGTGIVHLTETLGFEEGKKAIVDEAKAIAQYYMDAGILDYGADFISIDKYGLDGGQQQNAPEDPANSTWFWNHDLWKNYLLFTQTLHETTNKPVTLWQIPVGHINGSQATNPYDPSGKFEDLANVPTKFEDSAGTFFLGDTFIENDPDRLAYFSQNQWQDAGVTVDW